MNMVCFIFQNIQQFSARTVNNLNFVKYFQTNSNLNHLTFIFPFLFCLAQSHWDSIVASFGGSEPRSEPEDISDDDAEDGRCQGSFVVQKGVYFGQSLFF
jgi:hypothetical protein